MGRDMWILMAEALAALGLLVFIVWWTMYADRPTATPPAHEHDASCGEADGAAPAKAAQAENHGK